MTATDMTCSNEVQEPSRSLWLDLIDMLWSACSRTFSLGAYKWDLCTALAVLSWAIIEFKQLCPLFVLTSANVTMYIQTTPITDWPGQGQHCMMRQTVQLATCNIMACQEIVSGYSVSYFTKSPDSEMVTGPNLLTLSIMFLATSIQLPHWYIHTCQLRLYTNYFVIEKQDDTMLWKVSFYRINSVKQISGSKIVTHTSFEWQGHSNSIIAIFCSKCNS